MTSQTKSETPGTGPGSDKFYSPTSQIGSKDKGAGYYEVAFSGCSEDAQLLLETYAGIPADEVDAHVVAIRDKAWDIFPYPCVGQFRFLNLTLYKQPSYPAMLTRLRSGEAKYLDIGFCLGQDIRKLVADGAQSRNIYGVELEGPFIDVGYELWRDKTTLESHLIQGSALDVKGEMESFQGTMNYVHLGMVLHVFDRSKQILLLENCLKFLKSDDGGTILGEAVGDIDGIQTPAGFFMHSDLTFRELCAELSTRTGRHLDCRVQLNEMDMPDAKKKWGAIRARTLVFEIRA